ncbi:MAG: hypothetical protein U1D35_01280 [Paracoccaceae bacterium]|nr:hypothetical protein [Paracoccaceae bacterium]
MPRRKDIWRCALVDRPMPDVLMQGLGGAAIRWLPEQPAFTFLADPFAIDVDGCRHVFAEYYDYRTRHGVIHVLTLDQDGTVIRQQPCLAEPWHLSYPQVFAAEGELWMLPEAHRSGRLTLYRAENFPMKWARYCEITLDCVPVDASVLRYRGKWWMFYAPATTRASKISHLHVAFADRLAGPWHPHKGNPVRQDVASSRPGGTPVVHEGAILLPVQDCTRTYGGAIRALRIEQLSETTFAASVGAPITPLPGFAPYCDGLHTMSACGPVTMIDAKRIDRSVQGLLLDIRRATGLTGRE